MLIKKFTSFEERTSRFKSRNAEKKTLNKLNGLEERGHQSIFGAGDAEFITYLRQSYARQKAHFV